MAWYSILPPEWMHLEFSAMKVFFAFALIAITPFVALVTFDIVLYLSRVVFYEAPLVGRGAAKVESDAPKDAQRQASNQDGEKLSEKNKKRLD